jgi:16S rRNA (cytidine1402-2'-O)-methyltransferase
MSTGRLLLIPVTLGDCSPESVLPESVIERAKKLTHFIAENAKSARAFLKSLPSDFPLQQIQICELNEHTSPDELAGLLAPLLSGSDVGLISEAGCPAIADPGTNLVALAHKNGIAVVPMVGPSSILLALMASGLSGQNFAFHGYLPAKADQREKRIRELEKDSRLEKRTQVFIETPYRNKQMLESLLISCSPNTRISLATDLTLESEYVATQTCNEWRKQEPPAIDRRPTVFLLQA